LELIGLGDISATGNGAANVLVGNASANYLDGGLGVDTLTGGAGGDGFFMSYNGVGSSADTITDFKPGEDLLMIDLASFGINPIAAGIKSSGVANADSYVSGAGARAFDANDYIVFDTAKQLLSIDPDGSGPLNALPLAVIVGTNTANLSASDFYYVV
jgi:Ca2+-binding RTX toxin-like protein